MFLGKPAFGWVEVVLGDFAGSGSYLTDIPLDCLESMIYALENHTDFIVSFDAEGWSFKMIADEYRSFIIEEKDEPILYTCEKDIHQLAKELYENISLYFEIWGTWSTRFEKDEINAFKNDLMEKLEKLETLL